MWLISSCSLPPQPTPPGLLSGIPPSSGGDASPASQPGQLHLPGEAWLGPEPVLQTPVGPWDGDAQAAALTHGHVIVRGVGESQQQFLPLAAQLVGLVLGLQLHLCRTTGEAAVKP